MAGGGRPGGQQADGRVSAAAEVGSPDPSENMTVGVLGKGWRLCTINLKLRPFFLRSSTSSGVMGF